MEKSGKCLANLPEKWQIKRKSSVLGRPDIFSNSEKAPKTGKISLICHFSDK
jgi:hypothetical protein